MSEQQANGDNTDLSAVDFVMGGEPEPADHSPEAESAADRSGTPENVKAEVPEAEEFDPAMDDDSPFADDSAEPADTADATETPAQTEPDAETLALQNELDNLNKRLHDTQQAMHKANEERSRLRKELEQLKSAKKAEDGQEEDDDWFSDDAPDSKQVKAIEEQLDTIDQQEKELTEQQSDIEEKAALAVWDAAAAEVRKNHPDFDELVYEKFAPLLDTETGNPQIITLWSQQKDKSPANAYRIARYIEDYLLMTSDPEGYRAKIRGELEKEHKNNASAGTTPPRQVTGKAALDMVNSAEFPEEKKGYSDSAVDDIFG